MPVKQSSTKRGYNYRWQKSSKIFLKRNPLCAFCLAQGKYSEATLVDHIKPHRGNKQTFWDMSNWQALCTTCHASTKQMIEKGKPLIGLDGWQITQDMIQSNNQYDDI